MRKEKVSHPLLLCVFTREQSPSVPTSVFLEERCPYSPSPVGLYYVGETPDVLAVNRCPFLCYPLRSPPSFQLLSSLPTQQRQQRWGSLDQQAHVLCCRQIPCQTEGRLSPAFRRVNSDPPHSGTDTAVDQEAGLAHSPLPTNAPFCLGLAERGSQEEGGWKRLGVPEFTRPRFFGFHNCMWVVPPSLHLEMGCQVRAPKQNSRLSPNPRLEVSGHKGCGIAKQEGFVFPGSVTPAESPAGSQPPSHPHHSLQFSSSPMGNPRDRRPLEVPVGDGRGPPALASSCASTLVLRALF